MFNPLRLAFARKRRGLTKTELAKKIGVTPRSISMFENNETSPSDENIKKLSGALAFPVSFFEGEDEIDTPDEASVSFRAMTKMSAAKKHAALSAGGIAFLFNKWIEERFSLPNPDFIEPEREESPEAVAMMLREYWGIGELPIKNVIHLLEAKGIRVFSLAENAIEVDAYSLWKDDTPFIFLNTMKSAERSKFDAAHELGHLIMHKHGAPSGREAEKEADQFASAFLMPKSSILASVTRLDTLPSLIKLKKKWGVSLAALAYRSHKLGIFTDWNYRTLCIEMSKRGYNKVEPEGLQREQSKIWEMVFDNLRSDNITKADIARDLDVHKSEIEALVFGLVLMDINNNNTSISTSKTTRKPPPYLHLVE